MSTYTDASLIITPNAKKAGKLYSIKPTSGTGDLDVVRATSATRVNEQGLIEIPRTNLLLRSEEFDNASWVKSGLTVTANSFISPSGILNADTITPTITDASLRQSFLPTVATTYTLSIWLRSAEGSNFSTTLRCFRTSPFTNVDNVVINVTNVWQRFTFTFTSLDSTSHTISIGGGSTLSTGENLYAWGAQLEEGVTATEYIPTTSVIRTRFAGITQDGGSASNIPRLDYTNGSCPSILVEPQRTNLLLRSDEFNVSPWGTLGTVTITPNSTIAPDGNNTADLILGNNASSSISQIYSGSIGVVYTSSFFIKNNNSTQSQLLIRNASTVVDATLNWTGSVLSSITNTTGITTFQSYNNGWYRIMSTYTSIESAQRPRILPTLLTNQSVYIWGAQLEAGSNATSYIPTVASTVTRNADVISKSGISNLINSNSGCLYINFSALTNGGLIRTISLSDGTNNNQVAIEIHSTSNTIFGFFNVSGIQFFNSVNNVNQTNYNKILIRWTTSSFSLFINSVKVFENTTYPNVATNLFNTLKFSRADNARQLEGNLKEILIFPSALTEQQCIDLTTL